MAGQKRNQQKGNDKITTCITIKPARMAYLLAGFYPEDYYLKMTNFKKMS